MTLRHALAPLGAALLSAVAAAQVAAPQAFLPGERWAFTPGPTDWIPRDVTFAARGEWVWAGPAVGHPHVALLAAAQPGAQAQALFEDHAFAGAVGPVVVRAGAEPDALYSLAQLDGPGGRRSELRRYDPLASALSGAPLAPVWSYDPGLPTTRPALLALDPESGALVLAVHDGAQVQVDWIEPSAGARLARRAVAGDGLGGLGLARAGERAALLCGRDVWVVGRGGETWLHETLATVPRALAYSADGAVLAVGDFGRLSVWRDAGAAMVPSQPIPGGASELPAVAALDAAGARVAVGWWNFASGTSVRLEVWDVAGGARLAERSQLGSPTGLQNFPQAAAISADGRRAAFGLWGTGDARPEVLLIDVDGDADVLAADLPGSVQALALDESGTRLAVARKDGHANAFGARGAVELLDTGERDLVLLQQPRLGGTLSLAARRPGQVFALFAVGRPAAAAPLPGFDGLVGLDLAQGYHLFGAPADAAGVTQLDLGIPSWPELVHDVAAVQVVFALWSGELALSSAVLLPTVL